MIGERQGGRLLGHDGGRFKASADAHADDDGGTGLGAYLFHRIQHKLLDALNTVRGHQHFQSAHVFTAKALGDGCQFDPVARNDARVNDCRRIILGIDAVKNRIGHDRFAQVTLQISFPDALLDGILKRKPLDVRVLPYFSKDNGQAGILADGDAFSAGYAIVFTDLLQRVPADGRGFRGLCLVDGCAYVIPDDIAALDEQLRDSLGEQA